MSTNVQQECAIMWMVCTCVKKIIANLKPLMYENIQVQFRHYKKQNVASEAKAFERISECRSKTISGLFKWHAWFKTTDWNPVFFISSIKSQSVQQLLLLSGKVTFFVLKPDTKTYLKYQLPHHRFLKKKVCVLIWFQKLCKVIKRQK